MHPKLQAWLNGPSNVDNKTNLMYLAELIAVNRGALDITKLGATKNESVWGRVGLVPGEALALTSLIQFCYGIMFALDLDLRGILQEVVQKEITRREARSLLYIPTSEEASVFGRQGATKCKS